MRPLHRTLLSGTLAAVTAVNIAFIVDRARTPPEVRPCTLRVAAGAADRWAGGPICEWTDGSGTPVRLVITPDRGAADFGFDRAEADRDHVIGPVPGIRRAYVWTSLYGLTGHNAGAGAHVEGQNIKVSAGPAASGPQVRDVATRILADTVRDLRDRS
ncbi:hypothetical protein [Actinocorallia longicatena]|uniref:Uncharacterized protein n=1 Tax=Actinocorallia longicatena TaxID=111803 RepID=A0ABP6QJG1_9ACTN